jgi:hypothetical protein
MKKMSKFELDVVVSEVIDNLKLIEESKVNDLFEKSKNKDLFLSKVNEVVELEDKVNKLKKEIDKIEKDFNKDGLRVYFISENNRYLGKKKRLFNINLLDSEIGNYSLYKKVEKEIVLSCLEELNVRDLIKDLVEKFK